MKKKIKQTIWIVEDDPATIDVYKIAFTEAGYKLDATMWGDEAAEIIKKMQAEEKELPDLTMIDLMLPDVNGWKLIEMIRGHEKTKDMNLYVMTNYTDSEMKKMGIDLKGEDHFLKAGTTPRNLIKMVKNKLK